MSSYPEEDFKRIVAESIIGYAAILLFIITVLVLIF